MKSKVKKTSRVEPPEENLDDLDVGEVSEFEDLLNTAADIRQELNEVHWKDFKDKQKLFEVVFHEPGKNLKLLNDLIYYQGGYPSPSSPPKAESLGKRFGEAFRLLYLVGRSGDLNQHLAKFGLEVVVKNPALLEKTKMVGKMPPAFKRVCKDEDLPIPKRWDVKPVLTWFTNYCCGLQGIICSKANVIKKQIYPEAKAKVGDLRKGDFRETVALKYRAKASEAQPDDDDATLVKRQKRRANLVKRLKVNEVQVRGFKVGLKVATEKSLRKSRPASLHLDP